MAPTRVQVTGLHQLVRELKGPAFKDVNRELRAHARTIANDLLPEAAQATTNSGAPQARALAATWRVHSDRVPVIAMAKVNPRFQSGFGHKGETAGARRLRRGSLAHGVTYGPKGGRRSTPAAENYYRIGRDDTGGTLGRALREGSGPVWAQACDVYLKVYLGVLRHHGWTVRDGRVIR